MKARTKAILAAADDERLFSFTRGICDAIANGVDRFNRDENEEWFADWFSPTPGDRLTYWLGELTPANLERRLTFIAMAAAVSETEK